jgi:hypothetical protein
MAAGGSATTEALPLRGGKKLLPNGVFERSSGTEGRRLLLWQPHRTLSSAPCCACGTGLPGLWIDFDLQRTTASVNPAMSCARFIPARRITRMHLQPDPNHTEAVQARPDTPSPTRRAIAVVGGYQGCRWGVVWERVACLGAVEGGLGSAGPGGRALVGVSSEIPGWVVLVQARCMMRGPND